MTFVNEISLVKSDNFPRLGSRRGGWADEQQKYILRQIFETEKLKNILRRFIFKQLLLKSLVVSCISIWKMRKEIN